MNNMTGFMAKKRSGGGNITKGMSNNCGHPNGSQTKEPESTSRIPKILDTKVTDKPGLPKDAIIK